MTVQVVYDSTPRHLKSLFWSSVLFHKLPHLCKVLLEKY
ncbi:hypothetical protein Dm11a5_0495 [Dehalococcoides mccartyi]|uniref:Uncharacterized protein n=1 Tax=Dehalococcoides mccartyi TaxID=61435 RepID=A0A142V9P1_9CHLR|nr:hypothetical protein Dm11a5_0495 [Dehalococcoides mccartyi]